MIDLLKGQEGILHRPSNFFAWLVTPFRIDNRFDIALIVVFFLINGLVLINAFFHDPLIGYDAEGHLSYIETLAKLVLVSPEDSREFFSPPLPYIFPAMLVYLSGMKLFWAAKMAQFVNFLLSVGLTYYLIKACQLIYPARSSFKLGILVFLGILPVYYKTFAFVRGEPYVAFFSVLMVYHVLLITHEKRYTTAAAIILGVLMGLNALSRQWGLLMFPAVYLFLIMQGIRLPQLRFAIMKTIVVSLMVILFICGWFYLSLNLNYGTVSAFNRKPESRFSLRNQPSEFYFGISPRLLFKQPLRPNFPNQLFPIFYSELWGDYWGYFVFYGKDNRNNKYINGLKTIGKLSEGSHPEWLETNYENIGPYLGRVNLVATFPTLLAIISIGFAAVKILPRPDRTEDQANQKDIYSLLLLAIGTTMFGYFWFLIMYPSINKGDTIKATYMLHIFPFLAILVGIFLEHVKKKSGLLCQLIIGGLVFCFIHNIFAMITHYQLNILF